MPAAPPPGKPNSKLFLFLAIGLFVALIAGLLGWVAARDDDPGVADPPPAGTTPPVVEDDGGGDDGADGNPFDDGGGDDSTVTDDGGTTPDVGEVAGSLQDAANGVVFIVGAGEYVEPEGATIASHTGTGFIIDDSGLAVTNNHVVAGAAFLEVQVPGEDDVRRASVVATSECSDLAVIDISGDSGFLSLPWAAERPSVGEPVFSAGYPLSNPEYTLTSGIISKEKAGGDSSWASIDSVLEHDARINPGNSGGPLLNEAGEVVGINYAGNASTDQNFAIAAAEAQPILDQLVTGTDVDSIGINGTTVRTEDLSGIWVSSVETGSIADKAGIQPGDFILEIEGLPIGGDGTMKVFCEVLRTKGAENEISIRVLRPTTGEVLGGNLNGSEPLGVAFSPAEAEESGLAGGEEDDVEAISWVEITDDTGKITLQVPSFWADTISNPDTSHPNTDVPTLLVSPEMSGFNGGWTHAGAYVGVFDDDWFNFEQLWSQLEPNRESCRSANPEERFDLGRLEGVSEIMWDCYDDEGNLSPTVLWQFQMRDKDTNELVRVIIQMIDDIDVDIAERILSTLTIN